MMLQVIDVIHEYLGKCDFVPATDPAGRALPITRHGFGDVKQVRVVRTPELDQVVPSGGLIR